MNRQQRELIMEWGEKELETSKKIREIIERVTPLVTCRISLLAFLEIMDESHKRMKEILEESKSYD